MKITKTGLWLITLVLVLPLLSCVNAEGVFPKVIDTAATLLLDTDNVSIHGEAEFYLDDTLFKRFSGTHIQVGSNSFRDVLMITPRMDGTETESGYTILTSGSEKTIYDRYQHLAEVYEICQGRNTVLRHSVRTDNLFRLCQAIAAQSEAVLPHDAIVQEDGTWTISLDGKTMPDSADAILTLLLQELGTFRSYIDYHLISPEGDTDIGDYTTIVEGILYCTSSVKPELLTTQICTDEAGRLSGISGSARLTLLTHNGVTHTLETDFYADITEYGSSVIPERAVPETEQDVYRVATEESMILTLSEVYGYTEDEIDTFLFEMTETGPICYPASHPSWQYKWIDSQLYTPFSSCYEFYPGEGGLRDFLLCAKEEGWLNALTIQSKSEMLVWLDNFLIVPNDELKALLQSDTECTAGQLIHALFLSCFGPEHTWSEIVTEWQTEELRYWDEAIPSKKGT